MRGPSFVRVWREAAPQTLRFGFRWRFDSLASGIQELPRYAGTSQVPGALECTDCRQSGVIARAHGGSLACVLAGPRGAAALGCAGDAVYVSTVDKYGDMAARGLDTSSSSTEGRGVSLRANRVRLRRRTAHVAYDARPQRPPNSHWGASRVYVMQRRSSTR